MNKKNLFFIILLFISFGVFSNLAAEENATRDSLYKKKIDFKRQVYDKTLQFLQENPDAPNAATLYYHLAEMSTEIDVGKPLVISNYFKKVLEKDPNFPSKDVVLYNLAYYSFKAAKNIRDNARIKNSNMVINWPDSLRLSEDNSYVKRAIRSYDIILKYYPDSQFNSEALYRLGTVYFDLALDARSPMKYYKEALTYFDKLAQRTGDPLQNYAIFQRGWTYFVSGDFNNAITDFTKILESVSKDSLSDQKTYFEEDAVENIAFSLIEFDGTNFNKYSNAATKLKDVFTNFVSKDYAKKIILDAIGLKLKYYAPMQAIDLYNAYLQLYPLDIDNPAYIDSIVTIYSRYPDRTRDNKDPKQLIVEQYIRLTNDYTINSDWFKANKEKEGVDSKTAIILNAYNFIEKRYYNDFVKKQSFATYDKYKELVDNYFTLADAVGKIDKDKEKTIRQRLIDSTLLIAGNNKDPKYFFTAMDYIDKYLMTYPNDAKYATYNKARFYCNESIYATLKDSIRNTPYIDTLANIMLDQASLDSLMIASTQSYEHYLEDDKNQMSDSEKNKELIRVILIRADILYKNSRYDEASIDYEKLLTLNADNKIKRHVYSTLAYINQAEGKYAVSEDYYRKASTVSSEKEKTELENNILATIKSSAETNLNTGDLEKAAAEYLRLAKELKNKDKQQSISYTLKAIEIYKQAGQYQKAIDLFLAIAAEKTKKMDILTAYKGAWTISDSLMKDWEQSVRLRQAFIDKYPSSNEAYVLRLKLIDLYENGALADKEKAATMMMTLFNDAYHKKIDIGEDKADDIFLNVLRIYEDLGNEDKIVSLIYKFVKLFPNNKIDNDLLTKVAVILDKKGDVDGMLAFEKKYPNHPSSMDVLKRVAYIYKSQGDKDKFENLARYIYKKDPKVDLLTEIAAQKLKVLNDEIDSLFVAQNYVLMNEKISDFKKVDQKYRKDNIKIDLKPAYDRFDYYGNYIAFHDDYAKIIKKIEDNIINASSNQLIKVNKLTTWKRHLYSGKRRIKSLMRRCANYEKQFLALYKKGQNFEITDDELMNGLFVMGKMYDVSSNAVTNQIEKYVRISNELNDEKWKGNPVLQKQTKDRIRLLARAESIKLLKKAVKYYANLYNIYKTQKGYDNEWIAVAQSRLKDLGILKDKIYVNLYSNSDWIMNRDKINSYMLDKDVDSLWTSANVTTDKQFENKADVIKLANDFDTYIHFNVDLEINPELIKFNYLYKVPITVYVNGIKITKEPVKKDSILYKDSYYANYELSIAKGFLKGSNDVLLKIMPVDNIENYFSANLSIQYDKEKLELFRTTETATIITDDTWVAKIGKVSPNIKETDQSWNKVGDAYLQYYKNQLYSMDETKAKGVWFANVDTTKAQTVYFFKKVYIPGDVLKASATFVGQKRTSLWVNGSKIVADKDIIFDISLKKVMPIKVDVPLKKGENIILIKVVGDVRYKGLIGEFSYLYKKNADTKTSQTMNEDVSGTKDKTEANQEEDQKIPNAVTTPDTTKVEKVNTEESKIDTLESSDATKMDANVAENADSTSEQDKNIEYIKEDEESATIDSTSIKRDFTNSLASDYTWFAMEGNYDYIIPEDDTLWTLVGKPNKPVSKNEIKGMEDLQSMPIWYPAVTDSSDIYFSKSFDINTGKADGEITLYSSHPVSIWVNNEKIIDNLAFDNSTMQSQKIELTNLIDGHNRIFVKLNLKDSISESNKDIFIFNLEY